MRSGDQSLIIHSFLFVFFFSFRQPENTKSLDRKMPLQLVGPKIKPSTTGSFVSCNYEYLVECGVSMGQSRRATKTAAPLLCHARARRSGLVAHFFIFFSFAVSVLFR